MGCLHTTECPLFPHLRSSLQGWRDYYCDSEQGWRDCARYKMSLTGERVPLALLPNGRTARYIDYTQTSVAPADPPAPGTSLPRSKEPTDHLVPAGRRATDSERSRLRRLLDWMKGSV